ncbi:MAG: hypothetical protein II207_07010, partial [Clostridia bacterium]|nr:hypothetical protein [Clostridia bacterium]
RALYNVENNATSLEFGPIFSTKCPYLVAIYGNEKPNRRFFMEKLQIAVIFCIMLAVFLKEGSP